MLGKITERKIGEIPQRNRTERRSVTNFEKRSLFPRLFHTSMITHKATSGALGDISMH